MSVVINEFEVVPAQQQAQQPAQAQAQAAAAPPSPGEIDEEIRRALHRLEQRRNRLRAT